MTDGRDPAPDEGRALGRVIVSMLVVDALAIAWMLRAAEARTAALDSGARAEIFDYLIAVYDTPGALAFGAIVLVALALHRAPFDVRAAVAQIGRSPRLAALGTTALCVAVALGAQRRHPLCMDEWAPVFQARTFATGHLAATAPDGLLQWVLYPPFMETFWITNVQRGAVASAYWPGLAAAMTPLAWLHLEWLLNPMLAGVAVALIHRLTRELFESEEASGWAVLLLVASPTFIINAASFYSMNAHLCANLGFALLALRPGFARAVAAGVVGAWAMSLHNPLPHVLFALPFWVVWLRRPARHRLTLAGAALGYAPLCAVVIVGWWLFRVDMMRGSQGAPASTVASLFVVPDAPLLGVRLVSASKFVTWSTPGLVTLSAWGAWSRRAHGMVNSLAASALLTFVAYLFVRVDQGHGWGYRYMHSAFGALPVLAAGALTAPSLTARAAPATAPDGSYARFAFACAVLSLVLCTAERAREVRAHVGRHLRQRNAVTAGGALTVHFLRPSAGYYVQDMIRWDPSLRADTWYLRSRGPRANEAVLRSHFGEGRLVAASPTDFTYVIASPSITVEPRSALARAVTTQP